MISTAQQSLMTARAGLEEIGYLNDLLLTDYPFSDMSARTPVRSIDLAAFTQYPPSYRSAGMGVVIVKAHDPKYISPYRALGAPQVLSIVNDGSPIHRWKVLGAGPPEILEQIEVRKLRQAILSRKNEWDPEAILRAKNIGAEERPVQLDFFDVGLLPALEEIVHKKLDSLIKRVLHDCKQHYQLLHHMEPNPEQLFRLIFRLIGGKLLADREHRGGAWKSKDAETVIQAVEHFYFPGQKPKPALSDSTIRQAAWDSIQSSVHLQNLSAEALAYIWEETLVSPELRREKGIHATPFQIAEYIVRRLPIKDLAQDDRSVFEPFCGHAPFLTAAMSHLRALLPPKMASEQRHKYFVKMLSGMEVGSFSVEIAHQALMLADYPNANSWRIEEDDVFRSSRFNEYLKQASVVLCNPPYGSFGDSGRPSSDAAADKQVEALRMVLRNPPKMLGFVLPRVFVDGQSYLAIHKSLSSHYGDTELVVLPDNVFRLSGVETVLLIAFNRGGGSGARTSMRIEKPDYRKFIQTGEPTWKEVTYETGTRIWHTHFEKMWQTLSGQPSLGQVIDIHRGLEYNIPLEQEHLWRADAERDGFERGLATVKADFEPYLIRSTEYLSTDRKIMRGNAYRRPWNRPKVFVNAARRSRGCWGLTGTIDHDGLICSQRFHGVWPKSSTPVEVIGALMNGAIANAFTSSSRTGRDNQRRTIRQIPIPLPEQDFFNRITRLVHQYEHYRRSVIAKSSQASSYDALCREITWHIDAEVLAAYNLPPNLEKDILDYVGGYTRPGPAPFEVVACPVPNGRQMIVREQILSRRPVLEALLAGDRNAQTLESFRGHVDCIEGDTAYVTLVDRQGAESFAECPADRLLSQGITWDADFVCTVWQGAGGTVVSHFPLPQRQLLNTERVMLQQEVEDLLSDPTNALIGVEEGAAGD